MRSSLEGKRAKTELYPGTRNNGPLYPKEESRAIKDEETSEREGTPANAVKGGGEKGLKKQNEWRSRSKKRVGQKIEEGGECWRPRKRQTPEKSGGAWGARRNTWGQNSKSFKEVDPSAR